MKEALCPKAWNPPSPTTSAISGLAFSMWCFLPEGKPASFIRQHSLVLRLLRGWCGWQRALGDGQEGAHKSRVQDWLGQAGAPGWEAGRALGGCEVLQHWGLGRICGLTLLSAGLPWGLTRWLFSVSHQMRWMWTWSWFCLSLVAWTLLAFYPVPTFSIIQHLQLEPVLLTGPFVFT